MKGIFMKKLLLLLLLSLLPVICNAKHPATKEAAPRLITVKFDPSFINAATKMGKQAIYKFAPFYSFYLLGGDQQNPKSYNVSELDESDILIIFNKDDKQGNNDFKLEIKGNTKRNAKIIGQLTPIDNLNGGFTIPNDQTYESRGLGKLVVEAITGPLVIKKAISSSTQATGSRAPTFIVKVENGQLKIDRQ